MLVKRALDWGYDLNFSILCSTRLPLPQHVPRLRGRFLILEAVFSIVFCACSIVFCACIKNICDKEFIPDFFLWPCKSVSWIPSCTHLSLNKSIRGDLRLTEEELRHAAKLRRQRNIANTKRYRKRQRKEDENTFLANDLAQHQARNPGRVNEIAANVRNKAKDLQRFRCALCDYTTATQYALDEHNRSQDHLMSRR